MKIRLYVVALNAVFLLAGVSNAPAPTTKDQRDIVVDTTESGGGSVAGLALGIAIDFESDGASENLLQDRARGKAREKSRTLVLLRDAARTPAAQVSVDVKALVKAKRRELDTTSQVVMSVFDPELSEGRVRKARRPQVRFRRKWSQAIFDGDDVVVANSLKLEIRAGGVDENTVALTRTTKDDDSVLLEFEIFDVGLTSIGTGMVMVTATASASGGYTDGPIIVDDDDD